ncbi:penicillin-binding protein 2 [Patescibacteria group bacterium]|nr:penicillin-binding protein 2 [Patescibacteria group bacterium]MBU4082931.1 penicillin-binding protein 2 [Patescibacteria group bacterium]
MKHWRIYLLAIVVLLAGSGIFARLFSLQILQYDSFSASAQNKQDFYRELFPERGEIFTQDLSALQRTGQAVYHPLAVNREFQKAYLIPKDIPEERKDELADKLSAILDLDKETVWQRINKKDDPYEPLKSKISQEAAQKIEELKIEGVGLAPETWRYYPNISSSCHLTGFVGDSDEGKTGQYGLEGYYEDKLSGEAGSIKGKKDVAGYWIPFLNDEMEPAEDGADLILTVDQNIQFKAEKELRQLVEQWNAESGSIIIMEPKSGAIRAMANWPVFDPNEYSVVEDIDVFLNSSTQKAYELGSVFKPVTMAIGIDSGSVTPQTTYVDEGQIRIKGSVINNVDGKSYGEQTMTQVLEKSLNTGAVFVQRATDIETFQDYIQRFNFDLPTGVDLAGETAGDISNLFSEREINLATISFGQGITVSSLGMVAAIGALANEGKLMRPFVVEKIVYPDGKEVVTEPQVSGKVVSSETAKEVTKMLVSVVENGFGKPARISGYDIAGKTGTAQMADSENGGYSEETIHSFVGFAPAFEPRFVILIKMDKPQGIRFASDSVSPVFRRLAEYLLQYLEIPPQ